MRFRFERIGPVGAAELTLGDLTVIAGRNNTGKTYLTYSLYGFLRLWKGWPGGPDFFLSRHRERASPKPSPASAMDLRTLARSITDTGQGRLTVPRDTLLEIRRQVLRHLARDFSSDMHQAVFTTSSDKFEEAGLSVEAADDWPLDAVQSEMPDDGSLRMEYDGKQLAATWTKGGKRAHRSSAAALFTPTILERELASLCTWFLCSGLPEPFILSAERFGISLFYKELDFTKHQLVNLLQKIGDDKYRDRLSPFLFIDRAASRYALPIKENIDYTRSIGGSRTAASGAFAEHKLFDHIKNMMEGYFRVSGDDIRFRSKARKIGKFDIPLHLASSSARGLVDMYFFLRQSTQRNQLLIIDEPESHLDTRNQIEMARLLARLVDAGLKVLVTTHSDYLLKEINNLIMLSQLGADRAYLGKEHGYAARDALAPESVRAYMAQDGGLTRAAVDRYGIAMPIFDDTIDSINRTAHSLAAQVSAQPENP